MRVYVDIDDDEMRRVAGWHEIRQAIFPSSVL